MPDPDPSPQPPIQHGTILVSHTSPETRFAAQTPPEKQEPEKHPDIEPTKPPPGKSMPTHVPEPFPVTPAPAEPPLADPPSTLPPPVHSEAPGDRPEREMTQWVESLLAE